MNLTVDEVAPDLTVLTNSRVITVWLGTSAADQLALAWLCGFDALPAARCPTRFSSFLVTLSISVR
jgi:hypothetical protein